MATIKAVTYNADQKLYVIPCGKGYSCLGYEVAYDRAYRLRCWLTEKGEPVPPGIPEAPMARYTYLEELQKQAKRFCDANNIRCTAELHPLLTGKEGKRARYTYADGKRKSFIVGKSTGWLPCHLEILTRRSSGGGAISHAAKFPDLTFEGA